MFPSVQTLMLVGLLVLGAAYFYAMLFFVSKQVYWTERERELRATAGGQRPGQETVSRT
jgi:hypothetical protein